MDEHLFDTMNGTDEPAAAGPAGSQGSAAGLPVSDAGLARNKARGEVLQAAAKINDKLIDGKGTPTKAAP